MVIRDEVVDLRGKTSSHDERVRRRETLVGAKVSGVLRDLKVNRQTDQVWMRPEKPKHRLMARRDGSHRPDQDFHDRHHRDDARISSRADKVLEDERSDGMRRVVRVEECRKHRGVEEQTITFRDLLEQRRLRHRLFAPGCPLAADVLESLLGRPENAGQTAGEIARHHAHASHAWLRRVGFEDQDVVRRRVEGANDQDPAW